MGEMTGWVERCLDVLCSYIDDWSKRKKLIVILLIWIVLFLPQIYYYSYSLRDENYLFYPQEAAPEGFDSQDLDVRTEPLDHQGKEDLVIGVAEGEEITFRWILNKSEDYRGHVGAVNLVIDGELIRMNEVYSTDEREMWSETVKFDEERNVSYYYRVENSDTSTFYRRAKIILEGGNPYKETRTDPPPLINLFFIPAVLAAPSIEAGGFFLSFNIYFALFILLDALFLYKIGSQFDENKGCLISLFFLLNPITVLTIRQDESIMLFMLLLPLWFLIRNRNSISSVFAGIGIPVKIWTGFWIPVLAVLRDMSYRKRFLYTTISIISAAYVLLFFRWVWGPEALWFLGYYGGMESRVNVGGISFWEMGSKVFGYDKTFLPTTLIIAGIGLMGLYLLYRSERERWEPFSTLTVLFALFLSIYPKVHWEYTLLIFPTILLLSMFKTKYLIFFYFISVFASVSMLVYMWDIGWLYVGISLVFSLLLSLSLLLTVVEIAKDKGEIVHYNQQTCECP